MWAALVVGCIGLERLVYAGTDVWVRRRWPHRLEAVRFGPQGLSFVERNVYEGSSRTTTMPAGLVLEARLQRDDDWPQVPWTVTLITILGVFVWSRHDDENEADAELERLRETLSSVAHGEDLTPPAPTGAFDIIGDRRAVMWGVRPVVPGSIALRALLLLCTIVALPNLASGNLSIVLWCLTAVTVALLAFPLAGAISVLRRQTSLVGYGLTAQFGELRALEHSTVSQTVSLRAVRHVGLGRVELDGRPLALRLEAMTSTPEAVDAIVPRSALSLLAQQAYRAVADLHRVGSGDTPAFGVPLPGGVAEGIEAASWAQRFVAEAKAVPLGD